jgi:acetyltransferase-like isoleucine patch superfamily enzyme
MNMERISETCEQFQAYLTSRDKFFEFKVDYPLADRVAGIYQVIFPGRKKYQFYGRFVLARIAQMIDYSPIKVWLYRLMGIKIGKGVFIAPDVILDPHFPALIEIHDYAILGWGAKLFTHYFSGKTYYAGRIIISEGAVIGAFSLIRGGVTIGKMHIFQ